MRFIHTHQSGISVVNQHNEVRSMDDPSEGNACHTYTVNVHGVERARIEFQKGPMIEKGTNGVTDEALLAIVIDRLRGFNGGLNQCRQNAIAITKLEEALHWLFDRTHDRMNRGVEGTNQP